MENKLKLAKDILKKYKSSMQIKDFINCIVSQY